MTAGSWLVPFSSSVDFLAASTLLLAAFERLNSKAPPPDIVKLKNSVPKIVTRMYRVLKAITKGSQQGGVKSEQCTHQHPSSSTNYFVNNHKLLEDT